jgi:hypothetical protein
MNGLTESRLALYASSCALIYALIIILQVRYHILIGPKDCIDFTWIWLSSKVTISGQLAQAYDNSMFSSAREAIVGPPNCVLQHLDYPPTLLLFTYPLGLMPYPLAFTVWMVAHSSFIWEPSTGLYPVGRR